MKNQISEWTHPEEPERGRRRKKYRTPYEEKVRRWQRWAMILLYAAVLTRALTAFVPDLRFVNSILVGLFFAVELFLLPPLGMAMMIVMVSAVFFVLPHVVAFSINMLIGSVAFMVFAAVFTVLISCCILSFFGGMLISLVYLPMTLPATIAAYMMGASFGLSAAVGIGAKTALDAASSTAGPGKRRVGINFLCSLVLLVCVGWPMLSYSSALYGIMAFKPAVVLSQSHLNHMNIGSSDDYGDLFLDKGQWVFRRGFYDRYINPGNNNIIQGGKDMIAGNDRVLAVLLDGILYLQDEKVDEEYWTVAYRPKETDAMVLAGTDVFIFGRNKVFVCGKDGKFLWKNTRWTSRFEKLSVEEQFDRVYDILERQNDGPEGQFSYEEAGVVAYAQKNGILLDYDSENRTALFARKDKGGSVTLYLQDAPGSRQEKATFTPSYAGESLPYTAVRGQGVFYLRDDKVMFISPGDDWKAFMTYQHPGKDGKTGKFVSVHYGNLGENGAYTIYLDDEGQIFTDTRMIGINSVTPADWKCDITKVSGFAGNYIYSVQYADSLLSKLTFIKDVAAWEDEDVSDAWKPDKIWKEEWSYQRIGLNKGIFG